MRSHTIKTGACGLPILVLARKSQRHGGCISADQRRCMACKYKCDVSPTVGNLKVSQFDNQTHMFQVPVGSSRHKPGGRSVYKEAGAMGWLVCIGSRTGNWGEERKEVVGRSQKSGWRENGGKGRGCVEHARGEGHLVLDAACAAAP